MQKLIRAYGAAGEAMAIKFARSGTKNSQRTAYWRPSKNSISRAERIPGRQVTIRDNAGSLWWSKTLTVKQAFARKIKRK